MQQTSALHDEAGAKDKLTIQQLQQIFGGELRGEILVRDCPETGNQINTINGDAYSAELKLDKVRGVVNGQTCYRYVRMPCGGAYDTVKSKPCEVKNSAIKGTGGVADLWLKSRGCR